MFDTGYGLHRPQKTRQKEVQVRKWCAWRCSHFFKFTQLLACRTGFVTWSCLTPKPSGLLTGASHSPCFCLCLKTSMKNPAEPSSSNGILCSWSLWFLQNTHPKFLGSRRGHRTLSSQHSHICVMGAMGKPYTMTMTKPLNWSVPKTEHMSLACFIIPEFFTRCLLCIQNKDSFSNMW